MPLPLQIDVEPTIRCSLGCRFCQRTFWNRRAEDMPLEFFVRLLDSLPGLERIKLQGMGEPLLHPRLADMVREATRRNIATQIYTNGTALREDTVRALYDNGLGELTISCDHDDPEVLKTLRPGLDLATYVRGVATALSLARNGGVRVRAWSLLTRPLAQDFDRFVVFVKNLGFSRLSLQNTLTSWGAEVDMAPFIPSQRDIAVCRSAAASLTSDSLVIDVVETNKFSPKSPCLWPFHYSFVSCDGFVQPCCIMSNPGRFSLGKLAEKPFAAHWNALPMLRLRTRIAKGALPDFCKGCYGGEEEIRNAGIDGQVSTGTI